MAYCFLYFVIVVVVFKPFNKIKRKKLKHQFRIKQTEIMDHLFENAGVLQKQQSHDIYAKALWVKYGKNINKIKAKVNVVKYK